MQLANPTLHHFKTSTKVMSETTYIKDPFGKNISMLDVHGNLTMEVIMLYTEDKLAEADRKTVDAFAATDEMSLDALSGFLLTGNPSKTRFVVGQLASTIQAKTGAAAVVSTPYLQTAFNFRKIAAAIAVLVVVGTATFYGAKFFNNNQMADNTAVKSKVQKVKEPVNTTLRQPESSAFLSDSVTDKFATGIMGIESLSEDAQMDLPNAEIVAVQNARNDAVKDVTVQEKEKQLATSLENDKAEIANETAFNGLVKDRATLADSDDSNQPVDAIFEGEMAVAESFSAALEVEHENRVEQESVIRKTATKNASREAEKEKKKQERTQRKREEKMAKAKVSEATENAEYGQMQITDSAEMQQEQIHSGEQNTKLAASTGADNYLQPQSAVNALYPGGDLAMYRFIEKKKNYTQAMQAQRLSGAVVITFDIEKDGRVSNAKIKTGVTGLLNEDALRVVRSMPKWGVAKKNGKAVKASRSVVIKYGE